jgi:class 3 adenylate cyclase/CheY-like chemotaxis protein
MNLRGKVLVVDDTPDNVLLLCDLVAAHGYEPVAAQSGEEALEKVRTEAPDVVLLDVVMPGMDGFDVCRALRADAHTSMLPVVLITALDPSRERVKGLEAGADDFLGKPIEPAELLARVRSLLRIKFLHERVEMQSRELARWNASLRERVSEQVAQIERLSRLKRFFSPQLAELIVSGGAGDPLRSHRREIVVVFVDLRGFTRFVAGKDPDALMSMLHDFHQAMGSVILAHEGTLERFTGDGMMVFFNDPVAMPDSAERAIRMSLAMQRAFQTLHEPGRDADSELGLAIGIAQGMATIGAIGFEGRIDYGAIGLVTNLAARICDEARSGEILVDTAALRSVRVALDAEPLGGFSLKGIPSAVSVARVKDMQAIQR